MSPLTEGRGLKLPGCVILRQTIPPSPLTEGRGLKFALMIKGAYSSTSPLTEGRGLKLFEAANI